MMARSRTLGKTHGTRLLTTGIAVAMLGSVRAQQPASSYGTPEQLAEVVVTAAPQARNPDTVPAAVTVITSEDILKMNARTVPDVLKYAVGVSVADWLGNGRTSTVDVRGFGETAGANLAVLVDGRRINSYDLSNVDWTTIPLERVERIEVVRGGGSVLYGDNASGGVINIITKKGEGKPLFESDTHVGSNSEFGQSLRLSGSDGPWSWSVDGTYFGTKGRRFNSYYRNRSSGLRLSFEPESWLRFDLSAGIKKDAYGLPGSIPVGQNPEDAGSRFDHAESKDWYVHFEPEFDLAIPGRLKLRMDYRQRDQYALYKSAWGVFISDTRLREYALSPAYSVQFDTAGVGHDLQVGAACTAGDLHDLRATAGWPPSPITDDKYRREAALFAYDTLRIAERVYLDVGMRRSRVKYMYDRYSDRTWNETAARVGLAWNYADGSRVFASFDKTYRTQLLDEFGGPWGAGLPLRPQTGRHWQIGVRHRFGKRLTVGVTAFRIDTRNEIFFDPVTFQNTSYEETRRRGLEVEVLCDPTDRLHLFANYTWMDPRLKDGAYDGNRIPGVAEQSANAGLSLDLAPGLTWDFRGRWVKKHPSISDWDNSLPDADGYIVFDAKVRYTCPRHKWLTLYAGVSNVFDEEYAEYVTYGNNVYPSPGRAFIAGVTISKRF